MIDAAEPEPKKRGHYKPRQAVQISNYLLLAFRPPRCYLRAVGRTTLRGAIVLVAAIALVLATALPRAPLSAGPTAAKHCAGCPPVRGDLGKMACGAPACAGIAVGLPAQNALYLPGSSVLIFRPNRASPMVGAAPSPDPGPPRPALLG